MKSRFFFTHLVFLFSANLCIADVASPVINLPTTQTSEHAATFANITSSGFVQVLGCPFQQYFRNLPTPVVALNSTCSAENLQTPGNQDVGRYGRNIWSMRSFDGRVYFGAGNSSNGGLTPNVGSTYEGIPIISFNPATGKFMNEGVIPDEQIDRWVKIQERLCIPGHDPLENWTLGNYYCKVPSSGEWTKIRNIPNAIHNYDMIEVAGYTFAALGLADNKGEVAHFNTLSNTWTSTFKSARRQYAFLKVGNKLLAAGEMPRSDSDYTDFPFIQKITVGASGVSYAATNLDATSLFPTTTLSQTLLKKVYKSASFDNSNIYIGATAFNDHQSRPFGLYLAKDNGGDLPIFSKITAIGSHKPWDILIRGPEIYVLTNTKNYTTQTTAMNEIRVYRSSRLNIQPTTGWSLLGSIKSNGIARSFEEVNGLFYFGLGSEIATTTGSETMLNDITSDTGLVLRAKFN